MKKNILLIVSLIFASFMNAAVSKTVNVTTAGTLRTLLTPAEMSTVTNLTVTGSIDARDFKFIRYGITSLAVLEFSEVTIQAYNGTGGTSTATSYPANEIPTLAFIGCNLTSITIGNSVTSIGNEAFESCSGLTNLTIGNSVTSIGDYAFRQCYGLTSLTIPNTVTSIGAGAFYYCSGLKNLTIPNSVISIGVGSFWNCGGLERLTIGNSVTSIGNDAFNGCSRLTSLTIPNSVTSIGICAFEYCDGLRSLTIGNSVTSIGVNAFFYCSGLTSLTIPNSVISIGDEAFCACWGLTSVYVYATTPIVLSSGVFKSVNVYTCTLFVPAGSKNAYQVAPIWEDFNIVEMAPSAIPALISESVSIYPNPVTDGFQINGLEGSGTLTLIDLSGNTLLTKQVKTNDFVPVGFLPKGAYVLRIITTNGTIERKVLKK